ncbi:hypothetical protein ABZ428_26440 [Micromonospora matsumotoense]
MTSEAAISSRWIQKKPVGAPSPTTPPAQARASFQMASPNLGQMAQVHTPTPIRNNDQPRDSTMVAKYSSAPGPTRQGGAVLTPTSRLA